MMVEASPVKYYLAKYFFLFTAVLQWLVGCALIFLYGLSLLNIVVVSSLTFLGFVLVFVFLIVSEKIKRVLIGENKIVVMEEDINLRFSWTEVKSLRLIPVLNLCKVKFRGRKGSFYFFMAGNIRQRVGNFISASTDIRNKLI